jgi:acetyl-CoA synthetase
MPSVDADEQDALWARLSVELVAGGLPFADHEAVYWRCFAGRSPHAPPPAAWRPSPEVQRHANLTALAQAVGAGSYEELQSWSIRERAAYWEHMRRHLGFAMQPPATTVLAGSAEEPQWFAGAMMNAASACFQAPSEKIAIQEGGEDGSHRVVTYSELRAMAGAVGRGLRALGLGRCDAVALYMPMTIECVAAYLGIVESGMVVVSIPDSFAAPEVETRLRLGNAKAIIGVDGFLRGGKRVDMLAKMRQASAAKRVIVDQLGTPLEPDETSWQEFLVAGGPQTAVPCEPSATTNILFSSGTTGEPKAIPWTHLTPLKAAADGHLHQDIHPDDVVAWPTNIGWMMGPWLIYATFANQATMALYQGAPAQDFVAFIAKQKVSVLGVVPAIVRSWRTAGVEPGALPSVRVFSSTGEASNPSDTLYLMSLANYKAPIIEYCGGTEIGGGHITGTVLQAASPATFTTPAMGLAFVVLADGRPVGPGGMGELFLIPPSVGLSQRLLNRDHHAEYYADCPKGPNGEVLRRHGDEVRVLAGGYYAAEGRADDTMNLGGIKVSSIELERAMNGHPRVHETAAVGVPPTGGGADRLVVFAVPSGTLPVAEQEQVRKELQVRIKEAINPLFRIDELVVLPALPRTASNKVMRRELRARYRAEAHQQA